MKRLFEFEVPGDPRGYTTTTHRDKGVSARYRKYKEYCKRVREFAAAVGVPIPLVADEECPLRISIKEIYFRDGRHPDVENVRKGVTDSLFYDPITKRKSNDKWVSGKFPLPNYSEDPRVIIIIEEYEEHEYCRPKRKRRSKQKKSS